MFSPSKPPQVAIRGLSPAVRKVSWEDRLSGREGAEQPVVGGKSSDDESLELPPIPPVRRSRLLSSEEPEDC